MISVIIPTYNAANFLPLLLNRLSEQTQPHELIVIDSGSTDETLAILKKHNIEPYTIPKSTFNHGGTRNLGVSFAKYNYLLFLTQDALPADVNSLETLTNVLLSNGDIAMAYGRQLPYPDATTLSQFARLNNYPAISQLKSKGLIPKLGIKTCHCSNSFAIYRKDRLLSVGEFPTDTILGEDVSVAARFISNNQILAYCAEAQVFHSHNYSVNEEFKRYFDIGVFHQQQHLILSEFSKADSEGLSYVLDELKHLIKKNRYDLIPEQLFRTFAKYLGYKLGRYYRSLPLKVKRSFSMHSYFWQ